jgi:hypothetical protein
MPAKGSALWHHRSACSTALPSGQRHPAALVPKALSKPRAAITDPACAPHRRNAPRETLPLTTQERMHAAWPLVWNLERFTVPQTSEATGVSRRTVDSMRKRWKAMQMTGKEPTGAGGR